MKKPCRVRRAHPGDAGAIAAVINESNYQAYRSIIPRELFRYPVTSPEEILVDMGSMEFYVCEDDRGRILGVAALEPHHSEGVGVVRWVYVEPPSQRRGVGTALLEHIEDRARQLGLKKLRLATHERAQWAIRFYSKLGFRTVGWLDRGAWRDVVMEKPL